MMISVNRLLKNLERLFLLMLVLDVCAAQRPPPEPWAGSDPIQFQSSYYYFSGVDETPTYRVASRKCRALGGHLVTFNSAEELQFVVDTARNLSQTGIVKQNSSYLVGYTGASWSPGMAVAEAYYSNYSFGKIAEEGRGEVTWQKVGAYAMLDKEKEWNMTTVLPGSLSKNSYICEREMETCSCAKLNEPVLRTFDGQPIQLDAYCQYTLVDIPKQFKVEIRTKPAKYNPQSSQDVTVDDYDTFPFMGVIIDEVRVLNRQNGKLYIMTRSEDAGVGNLIFGYTSNGTLLKLGQYYDPWFEVGRGMPWSDGSITLEQLDYIQTVSQFQSTFGSALNPFAFTVTMNSTKLRVFYDGANVELALDYPTGNKRPLKGLCGTCNDKGELIGRDGGTTTSTYADGYSWISEIDQCPASMYRPAACVSDLMYRRAVERCQPLVDYKGIINVNTDGCISSYVTLDIRDRENLFTACVSSTCEYGPKASCYYFRKALWYCGYEETKQDQFLTDQATLDCQPDMICSQMNSGGNQYDDNTAFNGTCYLVLSDKNYTAYAAERACQSFYGHMVTAHSRDELLNLQDTFVNGQYAPPGDGTSKFWIGRVLGNQQLYGAYEKEANIDGSRSDFGFADTSDAPLGLRKNSEGPCLVMDTTKGWVTKNCSAPIQGVVCSYRSYVPCGDTDCYYPMKCDKQTGTCYDACFDQGFLSAGECFSSFPLPHTPVTASRPTTIPVLAS